MKIYSLLILTLLLCLFSCADSGPVSIGKLDCKISVSKITPNSAIVTVDFEEAENNLLNAGGYAPEDVILVDYPVSDSDDYHGGKMGIGFSNSDGIYSFSFNELSPNTTYYVLISTNIRFNEDEEGIHSYYYSGYSFKTTDENDSSFLSDLDFEVIATTGMYKDEYCTIIRVIFPSELKGISTSEFSLYISESEDMSDPIKNIDCKGISYESYVDFIFPCLADNKIYYLELTGDFSYGGHIYENTDIKLKNRLYISESKDFNSVKCEYYQSLNTNEGSLFVLKVTLPETLSFRNSHSKLYASVNENIAEKLNSWGCNWISNKERAFMFTDLKYDTYFFELNGDFKFMSPIGDQNLDNVIFKLEKPITLTRMSDGDVKCELREYEHVEDSKGKYTVVEVTLPGNFLFTSEYGATLYASHSSAMDSAVQSSFARGSGNTMFFYFPVLDKTQYFFELKSYVAYSGEFSFCNVEIKIPEGLNLENL